MAVLVNGDGAHHITSESPLGYSTWISRDSKSFSEKRGA